MNKTFPLLYGVTKKLCKAFVFSLSANMAASAKKKKKRKAISLTDFLSEDGGTGGISTYVPKPVTWADATDNLEGDVSTTWHSNDDSLYKAPPTDRSVLPTAAQLLRNPILTGAIFPNHHPTLLF